MLRAAHGARDPISELGASHRGVTCTGVVSIMLCGGYTCHLLRQDMQWCHVQDHHGVQISAGSEFGRTSRCTYGLVSIFEEEHFF